MPKIIPRILLGAAPHAILTIAAAFLLNDFQDGFLVVALILLIAHLVAMLGLHIRVGIPESLILAYAISAAASYLICWKVILTDQAALDGSGIATLIFGGMLIAATLLLRIASLIIRFFHNKARVNH